MIAAARLRSSGLYMPKQPAPPPARSVAQGARTTAPSAPGAPAPARAAPEATTGAPPARAARDRPACARPPGRGRCGGARGLRAGARPGLAGRPSAGAGAPPRAEDVGERAAARGRVAVRAAPDAGAARVPRHRRRSRARRRPGSPSRPATRPGWSASAARPRTRLRRGWRCRPSPCGRWPAPTSGSPGSGTPHLRLAVEGSLPRWIVERFVAELGEDEARQLVRGPQPARPAHGAGQRAPRRPRGAAGPAPGRGRRRRPSRPASRPGGWCSTATRTPSRSPSFQEGLVRDPGRGQPAHRARLRGAAGQGGGGRLRRGGRQVPGPGGRDAQQGVALGARLRRRPARRGAPPGAAGQRGQPAHPRHPGRRRGGRRRSPTWRARRRWCWWTPPAAAWERCGASPTPAGGSSPRTRPASPRCSASSWAASPTLVAPGGRLVYATCAMGRTENGDVASLRGAGSWGSRRRRSMTLLGAERAAALGAIGNQVELFPHRHGTDGFFFAAFTAGLATWTSRRRAVNRFRLPGAGSGSFAGEKMPELPEVEFAARCLRRWALGPADRGGGARPARAAHLPPGRPGRLRPGGHRGPGPRRPAHRQAAAGHARSRAARRSAWSPTSA